MRQRFFLLVTLAVLFNCLTLSAKDSQKTYTVKDVPNVRILDCRQYVSDPDGILTSAARDTINAMCQRLERLSDIRTAVVVLPSIGEATPFDFSVELFRSWGIGSKNGDNGLLILFVEDQRRVRFTTGYGIEGDLPDAIAKRIQQQQMIPLFRRGDYSGGMVAGMRAVCNVLKDTRSADATKTGSGHSPFPYIFIVLTILLFCFLPSYLNRHGKRCPKCRRHTLRLVSSRDSIDQYGQRHRHKTYICASCGHIVNKHNDGMGSGSGTDSLLFGLFLGSLLGGRHGRGGGFGSGGFTGGGSWGGGSTGGGGAESGW